MNSSFWKVPDRKLAIALTLSVIFIVAAAFAYSAIQPLGYAILGTPFNLPRFAISLSTLAGIYSIGTGSEGIYSALAILALAAFFIARRLHVGVKFWGLYSPFNGLHYEVICIVPRNAARYFFKALFKKLSLRKAIAPVKFRISYRLLSVAVLGTLLILTLVTVAGNFTILQHVFAMSAPGSVATNSTVSPGLQSEQPVPEFSAIGIVAFSALAASLYLLRRRRR